MVVILILIGIAVIFQAFEELTIDRPSFFDSWPKPKNKPDFYFNDVSWLYKYRNSEYKGKDTPPAFIGAKTWLIWLTDARHLFKMIKLITLNIAFVLSLDLNWWWLFVLQLLYHVIFEITYNKIK